MIHHTKPRNTVHFKITARALLLLIGILATACSDATGPATPEVTGRWSVTLDNLTLSPDTAEPTSCTVEGMVLTLSQNGTHLSASTTGGALSCEDVTTVTVYIEDQQGEGTISGDRVTFTVRGGDLTWSFTGTVDSSTSMNGHVTINGSGGSGEAEFHATRS